MAYAEFVNYLTYQQGSIISYRGAVFVFTTTHVPGPWDPSQVTQVHNVAASTSSNFNTLPDYNLSRPLSSPRFKIIYEQNNDEITIDGNFIDDPVVYAPGEPAPIYWHDGVHISKDGLWAYSLAGWQLSKGTGIVFGEYGTTGFISGSDSFVIIMPAQDITLYAQWTKTPTIDVNLLGEVKFKEAYSSFDLDKLVIPEYFKDIRTKTIVSNAFRGTEISENVFSGTNISELVLPASIIEIEENAFNGWKGHTIKFVDASITEKYPALTLDAGCFENATELTNITLPYRWRGATGKLIIEPLERNFDIFIRNRKEIMAEALIEDEEDEEGVEAYIAPTATDPFVVTLYWGWNN